MTDSASLDPGGRPAAAGPSPEETRAALEAVLTSSGFDTLPRLRQFLKYICDLTLAGEGARINEYLIGREVFGRDDDYSPSDDGVVRRQAHALRQKLLKYYANEGASAAVRIELPLGAYVPTFRYAEPRPIDPPRAAAPTPVAPPPREGASSSPGGSVPPLRRPVLAAVGAGAAMFAAGLLVGRGRRPPSAPRRPAAPRAVRAIWGPWLDDPSGLTICLSNPKTASVVHSAEPDPARQRHAVPPGTDEEGRYRRAFSLPPGGELYMSPDTSHGKVLETYAAIRLTELFVGHGAVVRPTQSRLLTWEILRRENVVVLGHEANNRWVLPLLESTPMRVVPPAPGRFRQIVVAGVKGPDSVYQNSAPEDPDRSVEQFALISMLPGAAAGRRLALITGLYSPATDMAAEFLTGTETLEELVKQLELASPGRSTPWYFQAVLRAEVRDRIPMRGRIVALRVLAAA